MKDSPLGRWALESARVNADLGARVALTACVELLYQAGHNEAALLLEDHGSVVVARAFSEAAWAEELPTAGQAEQKTKQSA